MNDSSPNSLLLAPRPLVARMGRWPLYALLAALGLMAAALIYSVSFVHDPQRRADEPAREVAVREEEKPFFALEGSGLALDSRKDAAGPVVPDPASDKPEPLVVVQREEKPDQQAENVRRLKTQAYMSALSAPLVVKRAGSDGVASAVPAASGDAPRRSER